MSDGPMSDGPGVPTLADELRERAGSFVNNHVGLWVAVEDDATLLLAANNPVDVFQAAADWLAEGDALTVTGLTWEVQAGEPAYAARLFLRRSGEADLLAVPAQAAT
ncbi:hypothetical protein SAMN05216223_101330 [Actinacidiphila yanglinensis]|uniref:Uncharacterized protein n=1 Tax=Actinacidiphila yanglinensis TaxID=310779 RepID=A0A1H5T181_9ACTN|nr:hypothetical protein [Actinacidiphila yanglinensis]SEF55851.1 hypothetical protein SAMN05216223_101330 [Actinacidiphila yanglinensis]